MDSAEQKLKELEDRVAALERPTVKLGEIEESTFGLKVRDKLIIPRKTVTGACNNVGEIAQDTSSNDLFICLSNSTWQRVGSQS